MNPLAEGSVTLYPSYGRPRGPVIVAIILTEDTKEPATGLQFMLLFSSEFFCKRGTHELHDVNLDPFGLRVLTSRLHDIARPYSHEFRPVPALERT